MNSYLTETAHDQTASSVTFEFIVRPKIVSENWEGDQVNSYHSQPAKIPRFAIIVVLLTRIY